MNFLFRNKINNGESGAPEVTEMNLNEPGVGQDMEAQLARLRARDRRYLLITGFLTAVMIAVGSVVYLSEKADSAYLWSGKKSSYFSGGGNGAFGSYAGYSYSGGPAGSFAGGGGCCGGGAAGGTGGCGMGGTAVDGSLLADLEKQALAEYTEETGSSGVKAKGVDYGCHIQVDIYDAGNKIVRSYGYQGGPLYVIK